MGFAAKRSQHLFVDPRQCHIRIRHNVRTVFYQVFGDLHCIFRIGHRLRIIEIRTGMDHPSGDHILLRRQRDSPLCQFRLNDLKASHLNLFRQYIFDVRFIHKSVSHSKFS